MAQWYVAILFHLGDVTHKYAFPTHVFSLVFKKAFRSSLFLAMEDVPELVDDQEVPQKDEKTFSEVRRKRKRDKESEMEVTETDGTGLTPVKRPSFPPVDASTTLVSRTYIRNRCAPQSPYVGMHVQWLFTQMKTLYQTTHIYWVGKGSHILKCLLFHLPCHLIDCNLVSYLHRAYSIHLDYWFTLQSGRPEFRKVPVPPHRFTPLKESWMKIFTPVVDHLKLQVRLNLKTKNVEIKVRENRPYFWYTISRVLG